MLTSPSALVLQMYRDKLIREGTDIYNHKEFREKVRVEKDRSDKVKRVESELKPWKDLPLPFSGKQCCYRAEGACMLTRGISQ